MAALEVFLAIAEQGTLRAAAKALGIGPPAVTQHLKGLEKQLGVSLFTRTTRSVQLTDAGRLLLSRAGPATAELIESLEETRGLGQAVSGRVRVTLPYGAYKLALVPRLARFHAIYPEVEIEFFFQEAFVDLLAEGFHAGIRLADQVHEDMIAVPLTPNLSVAFFASPAYLERRGTPKTPEELLHHDCIRYRYIGSGQLYEWRFRGPKGPYGVAVSGPVIVNSFDAAVEAARQGLGIAQNFREEVEEDLASGKLVPLLDRYALKREGFHLYYPRAYAKLRVLRSFVDFLRARAFQDGAPSSNGGIA